MTAVALDGSGNALSAESISWSSSAPGIADVSSSGLVTGVSPGSVTVTASTQDVSAGASVEVVEGGPPPPPPPGGVACEAIAPAGCWYVSASASSGGDGSFASPFRRPQDAADRAGPGDFIYLRGGEYSEANGNGSGVSIISSCCQSGRPGAFITLKSYPGEQAVGRGQFGANGIPSENRYSVDVRLSYWRIEGLRLFNGGIRVGFNSLPGSGPDVENVWIVGNHLSDHLCKIGNCGVITITGQTTQGGPVNNELDPENIFVHNNIVHTVWGIQQNGSGPLSWDQDGDVEHHACLMLQKSGGLVEIKDNDFSECPSIFYAKWESPGPTYITNNNFGPAQYLANRWRAVPPICSGNTLTGIPQLGEIGSC